jgi:hypothetical protein
VVVEAVTPMEIRQVEVVVQEDLELLQVLQ